MYILQPLRQKQTNKTKTRDQKRNLIPSNHGNPKQKQSKNKGPRNAFNLSDDTFVHI